MVLNHRGDFYIRPVLSMLQILIYRTDKATHAGAQKYPFKPKGWDHIFLIQRGRSSLLGTYWAISGRLQLRIRHRSFKVVVVMGIFFRSLLIVELEILCLYMSE